MIKKILIISAVVIMIPISMVFLLYFIIVGPPWVLKTSLITIGILVFFFLVGVAASLSVYKHESGLSTKKYKKYVDHERHTQVCERIKDIYQEHYETYNKEYLPKLKKLKALYLLFFFPGSFYESTLEEQGFFKKKEELARSILHKYIVEMISHSLYKPKSDFEYTFNPFKERLKMEFKNALNTDKQDRQLEKEIANLCINTDFVSRKYIKPKGFFSFSPHEKFLLDANTKYRFIDENRFNISIYNSAFTKKDKELRTVYYREDGKTKTREEYVDVEETLFCGILCVIEKPIVYKTRFLLASNSWPWSFLSLKGLEYELSYPGIHEKMKIQTQEEDPIEIRKIFQPRFAEDLINEFDKDQTPIAVLSDPSNNSTIIGISNIDIKDNKDLSIYIEGVDSFFLYGFENAKNMLAKDFYVLNRLRLMIEMLDNVEAFGEPENKISFIY